MQETQICQIVARQRAYFQTGATLPVEARLETLGKLRKAMKDYQVRIQAALLKDLGKCELEGFMCETGLSLSELSYVEKHLKQWGQEQIRRNNIPAQIICLEQYFEQPITPCTDKGSRSK